MNELNLTLNLPLLQNHRQKWSNLHIKQLMKKRRVWNVQPFGFHLKMFQLHANVLLALIHRFVLVESTYCYRTSRRKDTILANSLPYFSKQLSSKIVLLNADHLRDRCGENEFDRCFQYEQRNMLLRFILHTADDQDLILAADADEIVHPNMLQKIQMSTLFWEKEGPEMLIFEAEHFKYSFKCKVTTPWLHGPRLLNMHWLRHQNFTRSGFYDTRLRTHYSVASIPKSAWHLSSFGSPQYVLRKAQTAGHSSLYTQHTLDSVKTCMLACGDLIDRKYHHSNCKQPNRGLYAMRKGRRKTPKALEEPYHMLFQDHLKQTL